MKLISLFRYRKEVKKLISQLSQIFKEFKNGPKEIQEYHEKEIDENHLKEIEVIKKLKEIIENHTTAIQMVKLLDKMLRINLITQFLLYSLSFCFVMFNFAMITDSFDKLVYVLCFVVVSEMTQFIFCYLLTKLQEQSQLIGLSAYDIKFYNYSTKVQKMVMLIIMRSQDKKIEVTAGKFYTANLESFGNALKTSIGYFTFMKSIYAVET
ncbi:CLUMA_CG009277, isoform A [Clunio marinus]|uniref:CLUMA_CG009277, isoform A n=1 Tax=Clunio marinus TaxID=568069 RepID=A0A1J1IBL1_9DIPT|nr:CLUMA_CG009277, isoform A [Clunio marinus]